MKRHALVVLVLATGCASAAPSAGNEWQPLFNGRDLTGWRANVMPQAFRVVDGVIRVNAPRESAHLFYVGTGEPAQARFTNFELEATVRGEPNANSGIFFHTDTSVSNAKNHLAKGYEVQLNSTEREARKTGSLYAIVDLSRSPVDETKWFRVRIRVDHKRISIFLNDSVVVDYTEPENVQRPPDRARRLLDPRGGAIALQAHDPESVFYFRDIRIRRLPD